MAEIDSKKLGIVRILQILNKYSDCDHPLTQQDIAEKLSNEYGIELERKAIGRNIALLEQAEDFGVYSDKKKGSYIGERPFMSSELRLLMDAVFSSRYITRKHSKELIKKLSAMASPSFKAHVDKMYNVDAWDKTENQGLFYNIGEIGYAIDHKYIIEFDYNKYGIDKKLYKTSHHVVSPYLFILKNQRYYVMGYHEYFKNMIYYRLDHITNVQVNGDKNRYTPIKKVKGYEQGIDYKKISNTMPYMFSDEPVLVTFTASEGIIDQMIEWFGKDFNIKALNAAQDGKVKIAAKVSPKAMEYFAMQYLNEIEVEVPLSLRDQIRKNLEEGLKKYR